MMTAYVVMTDHPLKAGDKGPEIIAEDQDVDTYRQQKANGESVIELQSGTKYSQYELLAGVLIPSGNNLAFLLARWSAGSEEAFVARMNEEAAKLGMAQTQYADPSGVSPLNRSTAADQLKLAQAMMANPLLAGIVGLKQTSLPYAGTVFNVNSLLGQDNLVGVKTGWTEDAGGCFLFAADWPVDGQSVRIYGIVMGQDTLADAFNATKNILDYVGGNLHVETVVSKQGEPLQLTTEWGAKTTAMPANDAKVVVLAGTQVATALTADSIKSSDVKRGAEVSKIVVTAGDQKVEVPLTSQGRLGGAGLIWRLTRPPGTPW
jgi:D-alanyl-D-alanine carboxypeptidase (penicillin-binding protein 5/6)